MTVSEEGTLTWSVPTDLNAPNVEISVQLTDKTGREAVHTFLVEVQ
jgi:hypothetical protein